MLTRKELTKLTGIFILWRTLLFVLGAVADTFLKYQPSFPYFDSLLPSFGASRWLYSWANFDGVHYLTIAEKGYKGTGLIQAFFPLFPYVLLHGGKLLLGNFFNSLLIGLVLSNVFAFAMIVIWFIFIKKIMDEKRAWIATVVLLLFPTSFFFGALYTESLFMLLVLGSFLAAKQKKWAVVGVLVALASATRLVGIFLVPALLLELWQQKKQFEVKNIFYVCCGALGLLSYMAYLLVVFGDPLFFFHVQAEFGAGRQQSIILYPQVVWRSLKILLTNDPHTPKYLSYIQEFGAGVLGFLTLLGSYFSTRLSYVVFALGAFLLPTLTGTFSSMPRYVLVCFPIFLVITELIHKKPKIGLLLLVLSTLLLIINTVLFIQGYWVA
jgi:hypothetical protein